MQVFLTMALLCISSAAMSMVFKKKFFLSLLLGLESILLNLLMFKFSISIFLGKTSMNMFSIYMLTLSAMEASMGMTLITLMSRKFKETKIKLLKTLKK